MPLVATVGTAAFDSRRFQKEVESRGRGPRSTQRPSRAGPWRPRLRPEALRYPTLWAGELWPGMPIPPTPGRRPTPPRAPPARIRPRAMASAMRPAPTKPTRRGPGCAASAAISPLAPDPAPPLSSRWLPGPHAPPPPVRLRAVLSVHWSESLASDIRWVRPGRGAPRGRDTARQSWPLPEPSRAKGGGKLGTWVPPLRAVASHSRMLGGCVQIRSWFSKGSWKA